jgi:hypothetical protein
VVKSTSGKCVVDRSVQLFDANNGQVYDTDRTSTSGTWAVTGENDASAGNLEVKALRRKVGPKHHRRICQAAVAGIAF